MRKSFFRQCAKLKSSNVILLMCLLLTATTILRAQTTQNQPVSGTVISQTDEEPLPGVTVTVKGTTTATMTDVDGTYTINAANGQTLVFSCVGFSAVEATVNKRVINISMTEDSRLLDEVTIVGYGVMKRSDLTGSVTSVTAEDMKKSINTSLDQALQGRAAGVNVTQNSGAPGGGISVSIRGVNSFNGNEPLYVVDGIQISGQTSGNTSALSNINPSDIVSMEVLKDASATAIYGTRAANGVILITTRQGQAGATRISYEGYYGIQQLPNRLDVLNLREYAVYQNQRAEIIGFGARDEFKDPSVLGNGTNWQKEIFRSAPMQNHQISITGGNEKSRFAIMAGYLNQEGIGLGSEFERYSLRFNMDNQLKKWLKVGVNSYVARRQQINTIDNGSIIETAIKQLPEVPVRNSDGSWGTQQENMYGTYFSNPVAEALTRENYNRGTDIQVRGYADITPIKGLTIRAEASTNINYYTDYQFTPLIDYGYYTQASSGSRGSSNSSYTTFSTYATYEKAINRHNFTLMAGHEAQESKNENLSGSREGFMFNSVHELNVGDSKTAKNNSSRSESAIESYFGRFNYNYDDRYLLTASLRRDGSSSFAENHRWGTFPSLAVAWRINNEKFMKNIENISNLKLRLGWGGVGNQAIWQGYAYGVTMSSSATPGGQGFFPGNYPNPDLKWERTNSYNVGLDVNLFKNRVELIADFYKKDIDNLLMQASLPSYVSGVIGSPWVNAGALTNKGLELTLNTVNISNKSFEWKTGLTFSKNKNKVTDLYTESSALVGEIGGLAYTYTTVGNPVGQFYGYKVIGMFKDETDFYKKDKFGENILDENGERIPVALPKDVEQGVNGVWVGDFMYEDKNGDGRIDEEDRDYIGNPEPKFTFGISNSFRYRDFDFNIFLSGVYGNKIYNMLREKYTNPMSNSGMLKEVTGIARIGLKDPEGSATDINNVYIINPDATVQRMHTTDANTNNRISNRFVEDGSYLRIKNISIGYTFPKKLLSKYQIENLRIYMNVQNLFTFTKYDGYDPEIGALNYDVKLRNIDYARYPSQRIYTFGLNVSF
ncbi:TonB-dependent receptor [Dysgonomonas sp. 521]|uniref:SusC/RagA family TonB-linked outer membrane protein n=1 Tax=Dysgonomonas sp. 521 TaxID=2302932 RepID=UPI0013D0810F|nr:TonB-dependent receptor [Dysgonomonas sp. 521]NDV95120.1 TonB-dependent receptor [Dysgonomonas sp. 521]